MMWFAHDGVVRQIWKFLKLEDKATKGLQPQILSETTF